MREDSCLVDWFSSYLSDKLQFVRIKDIMSDTVVTSTEAPEGTILSPILFNLYTWDFCNNFEMLPYDTAIIGRIKDNKKTRGVRCGTLLSDVIQTACS